MNPFIDFFSLLSLLLQVSWGRFESMMSIKNVEIFYFLEIFQQRLELNYSPKLMFPAVNGLPNSEWLQRISQLNEDGV